MHPLEVILQLQLGSDQAAVLSLPSIISSLTPAHFEASPHLQKWISRVTSLMHSKHPGARWAGLCLALQTSILKKDLMMETAQNWIGITLPMLSRDEAPPTWSACIRLLDYIFVSAVGMPEFQRQLAVPNVPKFSAALISLAEKKDAEHPALAALTRLIPLYPTLHRTLHASLSSLSFRLLSGSLTSPTPSCAIEHACSLHSVLHFVGGKVGAAEFWRKNIDTAIANAWFAFGALRTTFPPFPRSTLSTRHTLGAVSTDPVVAISLSLDRLKCSVHLIRKLLTAVTLRPVPVPIGELVKLALHLLRCAPDEAHNNLSEATRRTLEISVIPIIWQLGCDLVDQLAKCVGHYLTPHLSRIVSHVTHRLEQPSPISQRVPFLRTLTPLLKNAHGLCTSIPPTRLVKVILPVLATLLTPKAEVQQQLEEASTSASKTGKKRARIYVGDEIFRVGRGVLFSNPEDGEGVVAALDALDPLLANPNLSTTIRALATRLLVTIVLELPRQPPATLSVDLSLHRRVYARALALCNIHVLAGTSGWINSAVGLLVNAVGNAADRSNTVAQAAEESQRALDMLLHPRLPPLLRAHPPLEAIMLFRSANAKEDKEAREALGVDTLEDVHIVTAGPVVTSKPSNEQVDPAESPPSQPRDIGNPYATLETPLIPTVAPLERPTLPIIADIPMSTDISTREEIQPYISSRAPISTQLEQEETTVMSTSGEVFRMTQYEDSEGEDEEIPEIDMRSDSD